MTEQITIHRRFNGPPNSGHGGYVSGIIADLIGPCAEVTLRSPPPLDLPLTVERIESGEVRLSNVEVTIAEGRKAELHLDIPDPPTLEESKNAAKAYPGFETHPFPTCFGCGHERTEGDGLRIFSGPVIGSEVMAAPWLPDASLAGKTGRVRTEFLWAALDCPAGWAAINLSDGRSETMAARYLVDRRFSQKAVSYWQPVRGHGLLSNHVHESNTLYKQQMSRFMQGVNVA
jgi:hypothetical protein